MPDIIRQEIKVGQVRAELTPPPERGPSEYREPWRDRGQPWANYTAAEGRAYLNDWRIKRAHFEPDNIPFYVMDNRRSDLEELVYPLWLIREDEVSNHLHREYKRNILYGDDIVASLGTPKYQNNFREALDALRGAAYERRSAREYGPPPTMSEPFLRYFRSGAVDDDHMLSAHTRKNIRKFRKLTDPRAGLSSDDRWAAVSGLPEPVMPSLSQTLSSGRMAGFKPAPKLTTTATLSKPRYVGLTGMFDEAGGVGPAPTTAADPD